MIPACVSPADLASRARAFVRKLEKNGRYELVKYCHVADPRYVAPTPEPIYAGSGRHKQCVGHLPVPEPPKVRMMNEMETRNGFEKMPLREFESMVFEAAGLVLDVYYISVGGGGAHCLSPDWWGLNMERMEIIAVLATCYGMHSTENPKTHLRECVEISLAARYVHEQKKTQLYWNDKHKADLIPFWHLPPGCGSISPVELP